MGRPFFLLVIGIFLNSSLAWSTDWPKVPNLERTPGALCDRRNADFDGYRYPEKIPHCRRDVDGRLKRRIYEDYNIPAQCRRFYTIDHLIPLSIGGSNDIKNLWPEHRALKERRPHLEDEVFARVSSGELSQQDAIQIVLEEKTNNDPHYSEGIRGCAR